MNKYLDWDICNLQLPAIHSFKIHRLKVPPTESDGCPELLNYDDLDDKKVYLSDLKL